MENMQKVSTLKRIVRSKAFSLFVLLVILVVFFAIVAPLNDARFLTRRTLTTTLQDLAIPAFLTIGAACLMVSGGIDFSQARVGAMAGMILAVAIAWWGWPWYAALIFAIVISALIGFIIGFLVNKLNFMPFIATMAMTSIVYAITYLFATDQSGQLKGAVNYVSPQISFIGTYSIGDFLPFSVILMIAAFLIYGILLAKTKFGRTLYLVGGNPMAAKLSGINSKKISYLLFINCSALSGIAGIIYSSRVQQGNMQALLTDQFTGLTAAMLGGISFGGGSGGMGGAFLGLLVIKTFNKGMTIIGASSYLTTVMSGVLLLAALSLDYVSQRRQQKRLGI